MIPYEVVTLDPARPPADAGRILAATCFFTGAIPDGPWGDDSNSPPISFVAQPPEGGVSAVAEAMVIASAADDVRIRRRAADGVRYTVAEAGGIRQVHGAGIASDRGEPDPATRAKTAFRKMRAVLDAEGLSFGHVVRQWNYVEDLLGVRSDGAKAVQGYQALNDVRTLFYDDCAFPVGYPAATGIGQAAGGVVLEFVALDAPESVRVVPLSNPRQTDAHRYGPGVLVGEPIETGCGKTPPKFERAKLVVRDGAETVLVSGTAAILGERSVAPGDVAVQTSTTIENIDALLAGRRLSHLRAYVKRAEDIPAVRRVCEAAYGEIPATYVVADVCRDELLVELEGESFPAPGC